MSHVTVIAELGSAHELRRDWALEMIRQAAESGADAVKLQYWSDASKLAIQRQRPELTNLYQRYRLPADWLEEMASAARQQKMEFLCSTFLIKDIGTVSPFVARFKIAAAESGSQFFVNAHIPYQKPLILSIADASAYRVRQLRSWACDQSCCDQSCTILYCVPQYPCPPEHAHLRRLGQWKCDGLSDHTGHVLTGALAVAAGATTIEVHMRHEQTPSTNPDYPHSLTPDQLAQYIANIRLAEQMLS